MYYCVNGNDKGFRKLLRLKEGETHPALEDYKSKYAPYFVEDYKWTDRNYTNMATNKEEIKSWWHSVEPLQQLASLEFETLDDFIHKMQASDGDLVDQVFEAIFRYDLEPLFTKKVEQLPEEVQLKRAFALHGRPVGHLFQI